jgi:hypothetical protein
MANFISMIYSFCILAIIVAVALNIWQRYTEYFPKSRTNVFDPGRSFVLNTIRKNFFKPGDPGDDQASKLLVALLSGFKKFAIFFGIVALFFSLLQYWLESSLYSNLARKTILEIEQTIHKTNNRFESFDKVKFLPEILLIFLLSVLLFSWPIVEKWKLKQGYKQLTKLVGYGLAILTIATSFTFFGNNFSKNEKGITGKLRIHELRILTNNKLLVKDVEQIIQREVVKALLEDPAVVEVLQEAGQQKKDADSLLASGDYSTFSLYLDTEDTISRLIKYIRPPDDFIKTAIEKYTSDFVARNNSYIRQQKTGTSTGFHDNKIYTEEDFKESISKKNYESYVNEKVILENTLSEVKVAYARTTFDNISPGNIEGSLNYYEIFGDDVETILDNTYDLTAKRTINDFAGHLLDIPLLGEILDPLHGILNNIISEKVKQVLPKLYNGAVNEITGIIGNIKTELAARIKLANADGKLFQRIASRIQAMRRGIVDCGRLLRISNRNLVQKADRHLASIKTRSRWQAIRDRFKRLANYQANMQHTEELFSLDQWRQYYDALEQWDAYMDNSKIAWYRQNQNDLEILFYQYIRENPTTCAAWGFILQQEDWQGAVHYYTKVDIDPTATGKPYYMLKYYSNATRYGTIEDLYTNNVDNQVGRLCPH